MIYEVTDEYSLWEFRLLRRKWLDILNGEDQHSVCNQLIHLLDDDTKWRLVNEIRGLQKNNAPYIHEMLEEWFWERQALGIRRLTEDDDSKSKRSVYSIVRLIDEMTGSRDVITRSNYMNSMEGSGNNRIREQCERRFDRISSRQTRKPDDRISIKYYLTDLRKQVCNKNFHEITSYANKFVAHSSDPLTVKKVPTLTLSLLDEAYCALSKVVTDLCGVLGNVSPHLILIRRWPITEGWDSVFASREVIEKLHELEKERHKLIASWG